MPPFGLMHQVALQGVAMLIEQTEHSANIAQALAATPPKMVIAGQ